MTSNDSHSTGSEFLNVLADAAEKMTEQARTAMDRSQQAVSEALANWALTTQTLLTQQPPASGAPGATPKPTELVDRGFEIAEQLLQAQHSFAKKLMESVQGPMADAAAKAASAAQDVTDAGLASTKAAANGAAEAGDSITQTVKNAFTKSDAQAS